jgi:hypothetical protein
LNLSHDHLSLVLKNLHDDDDDDDDEEHFSHFLLCVPQNCGI